MNQISKTALIKQYDAHAARLLVGAHLKALPRAKRQHQKYEVLKELPTPEQYEKTKRAHYTRGMDGLVDTAFSELESLAEEMREWYDNMPEGFQGADKGQQVDEAASTLENIARPDVPTWAGELLVFYPDAIETSSRSDRRDEAVGILNACIEYISEALDQKRFTLLSGTVVELDDDGISELESLRDDLQNTADEMDGVDFPGMY